MKKNLPNILSMARIACALAMLLASGLSFFVLYAFCGVSDVLDGYFARKLKATSHLGAKLDSLADFLFWGIVLIKSIPFFLEKSSFLLILLASITILIRLANLLVTRKKFMQWGMIHTLGNKISGITLYCLLPFCLFLGRIPTWASLSAGLIAILSATEELLILLKVSLYDANCTSFFTMPKQPPAHPCP